MTVFCNAASASYARLPGQKRAQGRGLEPHGPRPDLRLPPPQGTRRASSCARRTTSATPTIVYALTLLAGLDGIHRQLPLPEPETALGRGPAHEFAEAAALAAASPFLQAALPSHTLAAYARATAR